MKLKTLRRFSFFVLSLFAFACSGGGDLIDDGGSDSSGATTGGLTLSETSIETTVVGETKNIIVEATSAWKATTNATWVTCNPAQGEAGTHLVKVTIKLNKTQASRTAKITFASDNEKVKIDVLQESSPYFVVPCEKYTISYAGGKVVVGGLASTDFTINIPEDDRKWITAEGNVLTIAYSNLSKKRESTIEIIDGNQIYEVKIIQDFKSGNSYALPLSEIKINGYNCPSDKRTAVADFLYSVSKDATTPNLTAKVEFAGEGVEWITIGGNDTKVYSGDEVTINDITPGSTIKVFSYNSNSTQVGENHLMISCLPIVTITTEEEIRDEPKVDCNFTLFDPEARTDDAEEKNLMYFESLGGIEFRGAGALRYPKKAYNFKLYDSAGEKREAELLNIRNDNSWILDAMFLDVAHMRTRVCFDIWNQFNKPYYVSEKPKAMSGTRGHHVEMFLNGEYRGLFTLTDRIDRKQYQIEQNGGYIYKAKGWTDACCLRGYSARSSNDDYYWNSADIEQEYPDADDGFAPNFNYMADMIDFVAKSSKEDFSANFEQHLDINSIIDAFIFLNMIVAHDNIGRNTFWVLRNVNESRKFMQGLWDLDGTLGRTWNRFKEDPNQGWVKSGFRIYERIINENPAGIHQKIYDRWNELKNGALAPSNFNKIVDGYAELMIASGARDREVKRWKSLDMNDRENWWYENVYFDNVDQEVAYMKDWWQKRLTKLNSLINELEHK